MSRASEDPDLRDMTMEEMLMVIQEFAITLFEESELKDNDENIEIFWSWYKEASKILNTDLR